MEALMAFRPYDIIYAFYYPCYDCLSIETECAWCAGACIWPWVVSICAIYVIVSFVYRILCALVNKVTLM